MCCLHKQCHISVNIICHPDILDWFQFPLGFAQPGTWLLHQTANSIRANACLRQIYVSGRHTFLPDDPCYTWHEERISSVQPITLCYSAHLRVNSSSPALCKTADCSNLLLPLTSLGILRVSSGSFPMVHPRMSCVPEVLGNTSSICLITVRKDNIVDSP